MNITVLAHYQGDGSPCASFVHAQLIEYVNLGERVNVIVPVSVGKRDYFKKRFSKRIIEKDIDGVNYYFVRYLSLSKYGEKSFNVKRAIGSIKKLLKKHDFSETDVVHAHTLGFDSEVGVYLKGKLNASLVITTHGSDLTIPYERGEKDRIKYLADKADAVVCVSSKLQKILNDCNVITKTSVILNGFDLTNVVSDSEKAPMSFNQTGNLIKQKRVDNTIKAFSKIQKSCNNATLKIVGDGVERQNLENLCNELKLSNVEFLGRVENRVALEYMAKSDYFIMPSVREGFGIVYLEAMASGCITIGTAGEGIADLIENGENGFLVKPDDVNEIVDVIKWCEENPNEKEQIRQKAIADAKKLTWQKNAKEYIELFLKCVV